MRTDNHCRQSIDGKTPLNALGRWRILASNEWMIWSVVERMPQADPDHPTADHRCAVINHWRSNDITGISSRPSYRPLNCTGDHAVWCEQTGVQAMGHGSRRPLLPFNDPTARRAPRQRISTGYDQQILQYRLPLDSQSNASPMHSVIHRHAVPRTWWCRGVVGSDGRRTTNHYQGRPSPSQLRTEQCAWRSVGSGRRGTGTTDEGRRPRRAECLRQPVQ